MLNQHFLNFWVFLVPVALNVDFQIVLCGVTQGNVSWLIGLAVGFRSESAVLSLAEVLLL